MGLVMLATGCGSPDNQSPSADSDVAELSRPSSNSESVELIEDQPPTGETPAASEESVLIETASDGSTPNGSTGEGDTNEIESGGAAGDPWSANDRLAKTLNIGAVYEVGRYETWALEFDLDHLDAIASQGFTAIRLPVRWADWASEVPPYDIEEAFFDEIDLVLGRALANDLAVVLDVHHYEALDTNPEGERERFLGLWAQIADRYRELPNSVVFELTNEPHDQLGGDLLNEILSDAVEVIRSSNPDRTLMIGPGGWYSPLELDSLVVPDRNIIVSVHYYEPFPFTHQGAVWVEGSSEWLGTPFDEAQDRQPIEREFGNVAAWATDNDLPIFVGEFGSLAEADATDREAWTTFIREQSEQHGFSWGYWDWASPGFGLYEMTPGDPHGGTWNEALLAALLGSP